MTEALSLIEPSPETSSLQAFVASGSAEDFSPVSGEAVGSYTNGMLNGLPSYRAIEVRSALIPGVDAELRSRLIREAISLQLEEGDDDTFHHLARCARWFDAAQARDLILHRLGHPPLRRLLRPNGTLAAIATLLPRVASVPRLVALAELVSKRTRPFQQRDTAAAERAVRTTRATNVSTASDAARAERREVRYLVLDASRDQETMFRERAPIWSLARRSASARAIAERVSGV